MTDSDGDTVPFTPESIQEQITESSPSDIFAFIRPHSPAACAAFDAIVNGAIKHPEKYIFSRQFLHIEDHRRKRAPGVYTEDGDTEISPSQWPGAFKLCLNTTPRKPTKGWYLGSSCDAADIVLAPSTRRWLAATRIAGKHARLFFHPDSYRLVLEARHTITTTKTGVEVFRGSKCRVIEHGELFAINDCTYTFELTDLFGSPDFAEELSVFMKQYYGQQWSMNKLLSPTSVGQPLSVGNYHCSPSAFAQGTFGKVSAGWAQDGAAVAIKVFKNPHRSEILLHQQLMQSIGQHVMGIPAENVRVRATDPFNRRMWLDLLTVFIILTLRSLMPTSSVRHWLSPISPNC